MSEISTLRSRAGQLTWLSFGVLFLQQALDTWLSGAPGVIWVIKLFPLALFFPGMYRDNLRSYLWLCFVCLGYFAVLVQRIFATPDSPVVITGLAAVVVLFISAMFYVRWRARELRDDEPAKSEAVQNMPSENLSTDTSAKNTLSENTVPKKTVPADEDRS